MWEFRYYETNPEGKPIRMGIHKSVLYAWRERIRLLDQRAKARLTRDQALERENLQLKKALATKVLEADLLQGVLRRIEAQRRPTSGSGEPGADPMRLYLTSRNPSV